MTSDETQFFNLESAAKHFHVSPEKVKKWIDDGLRCFPLGDANQYHSHDYIFMMEWFVEFFRQRGTISRRLDKSKVRGDAKPKKPSVAYNRDEPFGPKMT